MKTRNQIESEINSYIVTNNAQSITAVQVNQILNDINDSTYNKLTDTTINGLSNFATSSSYTSGNSVIYDGYIYNANINTGPGSFVDASWTRIQKLKVTGTRAALLSLAGSSSLIPGSMYHIQPGVVDIFIWAISTTAFNPIAYNLITGQAGLYDINSDVFTQFATGSQGNTGPQGATGSVGLTGVQGFTGPQGATGVGVQGVTGPQGFTGVQGVTGPQGFQGLAGPGGDITYYGIFYDTTEQTNAGSTNENVVNFQYDESSNGTSIYAGSSIYFDNAGTYKVSFSLQFTKTDAGQDFLNIWLKLNGTNLDYTNTIHTLEQLATNQRISYDYIITVTSASYLQICWSSPDIQLKLTTLGTQSSPDRPVTTSAYVDVHKIIYSGYEGIPGSPGFFLIAFSNVTHTNPVANTARYMTFSNVVSSQGINLINNKEIQVDYTGVYNIQFSAQVGKTDAGDDVLDIWFRKNGVNIPDSNSSVMLHGANSVAVPSWNYMDYLNAGDYVEIMYSSADTTISLFALGTQSSPERPAIPSIILTVQQVQYQNEAGASGVQGSTGPQGATGVGVQGVTGPQGNTGVQGVTGSQGNTGVQGVTGSQGYQGVTGPQGDRGFQGFTGPQGNVGSQGSTGAQGTTGAGVQGSTGLQGSTGIQGSTGPQGATGAGVQGSTGLQGSTGPQGSTGTQGPQGPGSTQNLTSVLAVGNTSSFISNIMQFTDATNTASINGIDFDADAVLDYQQFNINHNKSIGLGSDAPLYKSEPLNTMSGVFTLKDTTNTTSLFDTEPAIVYGGLNGLGVSDGLGRFYPAPISRVLAGNGVDLSSLYYLGVDFGDPRYESTIKIQATDNSGGVDYGNGPKISLNVVSTDNLSAGVGPGTSELSLYPNDLQIKSNNSLRAQFQNEYAYIQAQHTNANFYSRFQTFTHSLLIGAYAASSVQNTITIKPTCVIINGATGLSDELIGLDNTGTSLAWKKQSVQPFIKATDGTAITGTTVNTYTDGVLIPANSVSVGDVIEFRSRVRKTGTGGTLVNRLYVGVNNSLTSANLIGTSTAMNNVTLTAQMVRTLVVKSATVSEVYPVTTVALSDDSLNSGVVVTTYNINWTLDQYFVSAVANGSAADSTRSSFIQAIVY